MAASAFSDGIMPASESLVALTKTINLIRRLLLLMSPSSRRLCGHGKRPELLGSIVTTNEAARYRHGRKNFRKKPQKANNGSPAQESSLSSAYCLLTAGSL